MSYNQFIPPIKQHDLSFTSCVAASTNVLVCDDANDPPLRIAYLGDDNEEANDDAKKPYALVVDDAPDVTEMLVTMLRFSGYRVVGVFSATTALAAAREHHFNVIVSDIGMPGMNGYELAEALRALPDYDDVPMIALTGFSMFDDRERALTSGFNAFLTKPIDPTKLVEVIERLQQ